VSGATRGCDAELRFSGPLYTRGRYHYFPPIGVFGDGESNAETGLGVFLGFLVPENPESRIV